MKTDSCEECKEQRKVTREITKQLSKANKEIERWKRLHDFWRKETKVMKLRTTMKLRAEQRKKVDKIQKLIKLHQHECADFFNKQPELCNCCCFIYKAFKEGG